ncbi:MAG: hypothetical protein RJB61_1100 [Actinomycetota bacterium]
MVEDRPPGGDGSGIHWLGLRSAEVAGQTRMGFSVLHGVRHDAGSTGVGNSGLGTSSLALQRRAGLVHPGRCDGQRAGRPVNTIVGHRLRRGTRSEVDRGRRCIELEQDQLFWLRALRGVDATTATANEPTPESLVGVGCR